MDTNIPSLKSGHGDKKSVDKSNKPSVARRKQKTETSVKLPSNKKAKTCHKTDSLSTRPNYSPSKKDEIITVESESSGPESNIECGPVLSSPKKAKAVKRPLSQINSIVSKSSSFYDVSQKTVVLHTNELPSYSLHPAVDERKKCKIDKTTEQCLPKALFCPDIDFPHSSQTRVELLQTTAVKLDTEKLTAEKRMEKKAPTITEKDADKVFTKTQQENLSKQMCLKINDKRDEISRKAFTRRVIRRSQVLAKEKCKIPVNSKIVVGLEEVVAGATVAFKKIYQNLETLLNINTGVHISPDLEWCKKNSRSPLANRFHVNFNFFMKRGNHFGALGSLRGIDCHHYPHPADLHSIIHEILLNANEHLVLHYAQELVYKILGLHPPCDTAMRTYYWSVMSRHFDDPDTCSRWENLRYLLGKVLDAEGEEAQKMCSDLNATPSKLKCRRVALGFITHILREDLRCWISQEKMPSTSLRDRASLPLVARLLWPQTTVPHVNVACRDLIRFHVEALKSGNSCKLAFTEPLIKMMVDITQLSEMRLPLKIRKPGGHMLNLAREIVQHAGCLMTGQISFYNSFGSYEMSLLLPLSVLSLQKPLVSLPEGKNLCLSWMINSFLERKNCESEDDLKARFWSRPQIERNAFLTALATYFKLYCALETWLLMRKKYRISENSRPLGPPPIQPISVTIFSKTFSPAHLMDDLRQTKYLLDVDKHTKKRAMSLYSSLSWS